MYSLILMTAMTGTADLPAFGNGYGGCYGSVSVGVSYSSCYGSSCYGSCYGSGCHGFPILGGIGRGVGRLVNRTSQLATAPFRMLGCHGSSCYGSACYGSCYGSSCYGSCYGSGCYGSCYGSSCFGSGCSGLSYGVGGIVSETVIIGGAVGEPAGEHYGTISLSGNSTNTILAARPSAPTANEVEKASANLNVQLPAAAKLYVDGNLIAGQGESRQFHTPELAKGEAYYYELKAEVEVNGRLEVEEKRVVVKGGESLKETFPKLLAAVRTVTAPSLATR